MNGRYNCNCGCIHVGRVVFIKAIVFQFVRIGKCVWQNCCFAMLARIEWKKKKIQMNEWNDGNVFGVGPKCFYLTPEACHSHSLFHSSNEFSCRLQSFCWLYWSPIDVLIHRNHQLELCKQFLELTFLRACVRVVANRAANFCLL